MYYLTPFRYLLEGFLGVILHDVPVICDDVEFARFSPPSGMSCANYTSQFVQMVGGYVQETNGVCEFCQYANGDQYVSVLVSRAWGLADLGQAASINIFYANKWEDFGIFCAYVGFNMAIIFLCSWLYLAGGAKIRAALSPTARKHKRMREEQRMGTIAA